MYRTVCTVVYCPEKLGLSQGTVKDYCQLRIGGGRAAVDGPTGMLILQNLGIFCPCPVSLSIPRRRLAVLFIGILSPLKMAIPAESYPLYSGLVNPSNMMGRLSFSDITGNSIHVYFLLKKSGDKISFAPNILYMVLFYILQCCKILFPGADLDNSVNIVYEDFTVTDMPCI